MKWGWGTTSGGQEQPSENSDNYKRGMGWVRDESGFKGIQMPVFEGDTRAPAPLGLVSAFQTISGPAAV